MLGVDKQKLLNGCKNLENEYLIVKKKVADPQFRSSINFGVRLVLAILYAIVIAIVMISSGES